MAQARIAKWVHFHLGVDRFHFRDHWGAITISLMRALEYLARGDWEVGGRYVRKAWKVYDIWRVQSGQASQLGVDSFVDLLLQVVGGRSTPGSSADA